MLLTLGQPWIGQAIAYVIIVAPFQLKYSGLLYSVLQTECKEKWFV